MAKSTKPWFTHLKQQSNPECRIAKILNLRITIIYYKTSASPTCVFHLLFFFCLFFFVIMAFFIFQLSSQHPYAEIFIGEPFVYTANIWNKTEVKISIKNILSKQVRKERLSLEVIIGLSTLFPLLYLLNTSLLQLTVFIQGQTICSFRVFLWRNVGKIKRLHRKSGENKLCCPYSSHPYLSIVSEWKTGEIFEKIVWALGKSESSLDLSVSLCERTKPYTSVRLS